MKKFDYLKINIDNILDYSNTIHKGIYCMLIFNFIITLVTIIVYTGGILFEYYLSMHLSQTYYNKILKDINELNFISRVLQKQIIDEYQKPFYFWIILSLYNISQKKSTLLLKWIYKLHSKGLSLTGIEWISTFNLSPVVNTFKNFLSSSNIIYKDSINSKISKLHPIFWIDNYSKYYKKSRLNHDGGFSSCLWTSVGIFLDERINLDRSTKDRTILPESVTQFNNIIEDNLKDILNYSSLKFRQKPYSEMNNLWTVPLRVGKLDRVKYNFQPYTILPENISSNIGLKNVIKYLATKFFINDRYNIVLSDTNIFWRLCKKYYEQPKPLSLRPIPILGLWHPAKMLVECVWRYYLPYIIGHSFHWLYPNNNILFKVRLSHSLELLIQLYLAYRSWNQEHSLPKLSKNHQYYRHYKNIKLFFNFFLPLVCYLFYIIFFKLIYYLDIQLFYIN